MSAHVAKNGMTFLMPGSAGATTSPRRRPALGGRIGAAVTWLAGLPRRQAVLEDLGRLSDRELTDIGLSRSDLPRIFDPAFVTSRNLARRAGC